MFKNKKFWFQGYDHFYVYQKNKVFVWNIFVFRAGVGVVGRGGGGAGESAREFARHHPARQDQKRQDDARHCHRSVIWIQVIMNGIKLNCLLGKCSSGAGVRTSCSTCCRCLGRCRARRPTWRSPPSSSRWRRSTRPPTPSSTASSPAQPQNPDLR